ncbi:hypothetical protein CU098_003755, partial [Rhizopus stolonifer]
TKHNFTGRENHSSKLTILANYLVDGRFEVVEKDVVTFFKAKSFCLSDNNYDIHRTVGVISVVMYIRYMIDESAKKLAKPPHNRVPETPLKDVNTYHSPMQAA